MSIGCHMLSRLMANGNGRNISKLYCLLDKSLLNLLVAALAHHIPIVGFEHDWLKKSRMMKLLMIPHHRGVLRFGDCNMAAFDYGSFVLRINVEDNLIQIGENCIR